MIFNQAPVKTFLNSCRDGVFNLKSHKEIIDPYKYLVEIRNGDVYNLVEYRNNNIYYLVDASE